MIRSNDAAERLERCFLTVFPKLDSGMVSEASADSVEGWDSVAHITLLSLIAEEFGLDLPFEDFIDALSYSAIVARLTECPAK